jgi:hypothetical protein
MDGRPIHVGKESNSIEARMRGEVTREDDYLNRYEPRLCGCGCGEPVFEPRQVYVDRSHKQKAWRDRILDEAAARAAPSACSTVAAT